MSQRDQPQELDGDWGRQHQLVPHLWLNITGLSALIIASEERSRTPRNGFLAGEGEKTPSDWSQMQLQDWEVDITANKDIDLDRHAYVDRISKAPFKINE